MGLYEGLALELKDQVIAELKQALAEKDREIAVLKGDLEKHVAIALDLQEYRHKYQQLMEKAIRFAEDVFAGVDDAEIAAAADFLKSPEVQAWEGAT